MRSRRANTDFLQALLNKKKAMESHEVPENRAMHSVSVQTNATETFIKLYAHRDDHVDFQCQWPDGEAAQSRQLLSPTLVDESFFVTNFSSKKSSHDEVFIKRVTFKTTRLALTSVLGPFAVYLLEIRNSFYTATPVH